MRFDPMFNQQSKEKLQEIIKKSSKITSKQASRPCKGSRWAKMAQKGFLLELSLPWGFKNQKKVKKNEVWKSVKMHKDAKEPPKADLYRFGVARSFKKRLEMTPKWASGLEKLIFGKVHSSSALPMRKAFRDLKKLSKINKKTSNFMMKTNIPKHVPSETDFWCFWPHFGVSWRPRREPKM